MSDKIDQSDGIAYDTTVIPQIVIDTNVLVAAIRSQSGASYTLLMLLESGKFDTHISVPLVLEYEYAGKSQSEIRLGFDDIDDIIDYICLVSHHHEIYFLWRPFLSDPKDDMVLEVAVAAGCKAIITFNKDDFRGVEQFGIHALTPKEFLLEIGELK